MHRFFAGIVVLLLLGGQLPGAGAQPAEEIVVAGIVVLRVRAPAGGLSIAERAREIRRRINHALTTEDLTAANFHRRRTEGGVTVRVGRVVIVTVTAADARANGISVPALAKRWLERARTALPHAKPVNQP